MKRYLIFLFSFYVTILPGQLTNKTPDPYVKALNNYVYFINESVHGLLIIQRMLENFNQDINKYVDLEGYEIVPFSNKDLPLDIFLDEEDWFYEISPYEWYDIAFRESKILDPNDAEVLNQHIKTILNVLRNINGSRFEIEKLINELDLTERANMGKVYEKLEVCVDLYELFFKQQLALEQTIYNAFGKHKSSVTVASPQFVNICADLYQSTKETIIALRYKEDEHFESLIAKQEKALQNFQNLNFNVHNNASISGRKVANYKRNIATQADQALRSAKKFYETAEVPLAYKLYGKFYYYYNVDIIPNFNKWGTGMAFELNDLFDYLKMPVLRFFELPHYYKVIYPKKLEKVQAIESTDPEITKLPTKLKERDIVTSNRKIKVDSLTFDLQLYDHMIQDGDIVSINFNGDWIIDSLALESNPQKIKVKLNTAGKNYLLLHAENVGRRPPNTMAVSYYYLGKRREIILKSDLNTSEMIEIEYVKR